MAEGDQNSAHVLLKEPWGSIPQCSGLWGQWVFHLCHGVSVCLPGFNADCLMQIAPFPTPGGLSALGDGICLPKETSGPGVSALMCCRTLLWEVPELAKGKDTIREVGIPPASVILSCLFPVCLPKAPLFISSAKCCKPDA